MSLSSAAMAATSFLRSFTAESATLVKGKLITTNLALGSFAGLLCPYIRVQATTGIILRPYYNHYSDDSAYQGREAGRRDGELDGREDGVTAGKYLAETKRPPGNRQPFLQGRIVPTEVKIPSKLSGEIL